MPTGHLTWPRGGRKASTATSHHRYAFLPERHTGRQVKKPRWTSPPSAPPVVVAVGSEKKAGFTYRTTARQRPGQTSAHRPSPWIFPGPADLFTADKDKDGGGGVCVSCQPPCWHVELSKLVLLWGNLGEFRAWQRGVHGTSSTFLLE